MDRVPDVVLVRKVYEKKRGKKKGNIGHQDESMGGVSSSSEAPESGLQRHWKLHSLEVSASAGGAKGKGRKKSKGKRRRKGRGGGGEGVDDDEGEIGTDGDVLLKGGLRTVVGEKEYELFLRELEDDKDLRSRIHLYKDRYVTMTDLESFLKKRQYKRELYSPPAIFVPNPLKLSSMLLPSSIHRRTFQDTVDALRMDEDEVDENDEDAGTVGLEELLDDLCIGGIGNGGVTVKAADVGTGTGNGIAAAAAAAVAAATKALDDSSLSKADLEDL